MLMFMFMFMFCDCDFDWDGIRWGVKCLSIELPLTDFSLQASKQASKQAGKEEKKLNVVLITVIQ